MLKSLSEKLFSIKKRYIQDENYRVITVLGITFKFPLKNRIKPVFAKDVYSNAILIYPEEKFVFKEKRDVFNRLDPFFSEFSYTIPEFYVYTFQNVYCYDNDPAVFIDNKTVVEELTRYEKNLFVGKRYLDFSQAVCYEGTVALLAINQLETNYFHWCIDCLPRLYLLLKSGIKIDWFIIDNHVGFQKQYLELLGIEENKIISANEKKLIFAKELVTPSLYRGDYKLVQYKKGYDNSSKQFLPHWALNLYREYFKEIKGNNTERVYISRKNATHRKIENEGEIIAVCQKYGFVVVELENLSVLEQIQTFRDAKFVVSVHGAGLTNIIHCNKDVKVLELDTENFRDNGYKLLTQILSCSHYFYSGKTHDTSVLPGYENVYIDPKIFESVLTDIINNG